MMFTLLQINIIIIYSRHILKVIAGMNFFINKKIYLFFLKKKILNSLIYLFFQIFVLSKILLTKQIISIEISITRI